MNTSMNAGEQLSLFEQVAKIDIQGTVDYFDFKLIQPRIKRGEIWQLGEHRLMCGDATYEADILALLTSGGVKQADLALQDPPYGMKCQKKNGAVGDFRQKNSGAVLRGKCDNVLVAPKTYPIIAGDDGPDTARLNYEIVKNLSRVQIIWGGQY